MQDEESPSGQNAPSSAGIVAGDLASKMAETRKNVQNLADDLAKNAFDKAKTDEEKAVIAERISERDKNTGIQKSKKIGNIRYYAFANPQVGAAAQRGNLLQKIATSKATSSAMNEEGGKVRVIGIGSAVSGNVVITTVAVEIME
jgi:methionyl-tRNA formyltransferase